MSTFTLGNCVCVIEPVDIVDKFMSLRTKADWLDMQVIESEVLRIGHQVLRLDSHELGSEPGAEPLAIERLVPGHVVVVVCVL